MSETEHNTETLQTFRCSVVHPRLFPGPVTSPGQPLKVEMLVEVGPNGLIIRAPKSKPTGKIMGTEYWADIGQVEIEDVDGKSQQIDILRRSLIRMAIYWGLLMVFFIIARPYPLAMSALIAIPTAALGGLLHFLLNGGLGNRDNVVRFYFSQSNGDDSFFLEMPPTNEGEFVQALRAVGLNPG